MSSVFSKYHLILNAQCCLVLSTKSSGGSCSLDSEWTWAWCSWGWWVCPCPISSPKSPSRQRWFCKYSTNSYQYHTIHIGSHIFPTIHSGRSPPKASRLCLSLLTQKEVTFERGNKRHSFQHRLPWLCPDTTRVWVILPFLADKVACLHPHLGYWATCT